MGQRIFARMDPIVFAAHFKKIENGVLHLTFAVGLFRPGHGSERPHWLAEDAVRSETVSPAHLPAICGFAGIFYELQGEADLLFVEFLMISMRCDEISRSKEQGGILVTHGLSREDFWYCREEQRGRLWRRFRFASIWVYDFDWPPSQGRWRLRPRGRAEPILRMRQNIDPRPPIPSVKRAAKPVISSSSSGGSPKATGGCVQPNLATDRFKAARHKLSKRACERLR